MQLFSVVKQHSKKGYLGWSIALGLLAGACSTGLLFIINEYMYDNLPWDKARTVLIFCIVLPIAGVSRYISAYMLAKLGAYAAHDLREELGRRMLGAPLRRLEELGTHRMMVSLTDDIIAVTDAFANIPNFFINVAVVLGCLTYMGWLSGEILLIVLGFLVVGSLAYSLPLGAGVRRQELARETEDELFEHFRGLTQGTKELKMQRDRRRDFFGIFTESTATFRDLTLAATRVFLAAANVGNVLFFILLGIILFLVPEMNPMVDARMMGSFVLVLIYMLTPLQLVLNDFPLLTQADVALRKIDRLGLSLVRGIEEKDSEKEVDAGWKTLELKDVRHTYHHESEDREFSIGPMDLSFQPGELVIMAGGNGSGKTTLAKILLSLYPPEEGKLLLDGEPIDEHTREAFRQMFSVVFSDFFLFDALLGLKAPDLDDRAREYLKSLRLQNKVRVEAGQLSTIDLSQGQRKRLALLTAFLEDRPIYLFDEWAADQDPEFKDVFYRQILPTLKEKGKLVISISHDDRYYGVADRIIKLDSGQLVYDKPASETEYAH